MRLSNSGASAGRPCRHDRGPVARRSMSSLLACRVSPPKMPTPTGTGSQYDLVKPSAVWRNKITSSRYSLRNATIGSTVVARRAGT
jgi:hypothetical protein